MNIVVGIGLLLLIVFLALMFYPMLAEMWQEGSFGAFEVGIGGVIGLMLLGLLAFTLVIMFAPDVFVEPLVEGACYRAYGKDVVVPVGKVFVPVHDVVLIEIRCP